VGNGVVPFLKHLRQELAISLILVHDQDLVEIHVRILLRDGIVIRALR
jgi:hypothetical protein